MNVRVQCACGQAFAFDVEPVNGQMPCVINCPSCGADDTQLANQAILESQFTPPPTSAPPASGLRLGRTASPAAAAVPEQPKRFGYTRTLEADKMPPPSEEHVLMGLVGGFGAAFVMMLAWYSLTLATNMESGFAAWGVGILAGLGVRKLGRGHTSTLGLIAAVCAVIGIMGGKYLVVSHITNHVMKNMASLVYESKLVAAHKAVTLKTDEQIRKWLEANDEGKSVSQNEIDQFRALGQQEMQDLLDGKPTKAEFEKQEFAKLATVDVKFKVLRETMRISTIVWLVLGVATAWRIAGP